MNLTKLLNPNLLSDISILSDLDGHSNGDDLIKLLKVKNDELDEIKKLLLFNNNNKNKIIMYIFKANFDLYVSNEMEKIDDEVLNTFKKIVESIYRFNYFVFTKNDDLAFYFYIDLNIDRKIYTIGYNYSNETSYVTFENRKSLSYLAMKQFLSGRFGYMTTNQFILLLKLITKMINMVNPVEFGGDIKLYLSTNNVILINGLRIEDTCEHSIDDWITINYADIYEKYGDYLEYF